MQYCLSNGKKRKERASPTKRVKNRDDLMVLLESYLLNGEENMKSTSTTTANTTRYGFFSLEAKQIEMLVVGWMY